MSQPPRARSVTPAPTIPPPSRPPTEPPAERVARRVEPLRALVAIAVMLLAAGGGAWKLYAAKADVAELEHVRAGAAANLASSTSGTTAQLGALAGQVQDQRERMAALETHLDDLSKVTDRLLAQVIEIAKTTGARQVPAAPPPERTPP